MGLYNRNRKARLDSPLGRETVQNEYQIRFLNQCSNKLLISAFTEHGKAWYHNRRLYKVNTLIVH